MTFVQLINKVEKRIKLAGPELRYRIKDFINDAILDFIRFYNWRYAQQVATFTTDDSGSYPLTTGVTPIITSDPFYGEIELIRDGKGDTQKYFRKVSYREYVRNVSKTRLWSIFNDTLYIIGTDQDLTLFYLTPGDPYPLTDNADENLITANYADIIEQWALVNYLIWSGDDETAAVEEKVLTRKINLQKSKENRDDKQGQLFRINSNNR